MSIRLNGHEVLSARLRNSVSTLQRSPKLIKEVRELESVGNTARIPAVALRAYAKAQDRVRALAGGYQVHLSKPVEPAEFLLVVANLAGRGQTS